MKILKRVLTWLWATLDRPARILVVQVDKVGPELYFFWSAFFVESHHVLKEDWAVCQLPGDAGVVGRRVDQLGVVGADGTVDAGALPAPDASWCLITAPSSRCDCGKEWHNHCTEQDVHHSSWHVLLFLIFLFEYVIFWEMASKRCFQVTKILGNITIIPKCLKYQTKSNMIKNCTTIENKLLVFSLKMVTNYQGQ